MEGVKLGCGLQTGKTVVIRTTSTTRDFVIFELGPVSGSFDMIFQIMIPNIPFGTPIVPLINR